MHIEQKATPILDLGDGNVPILGPFFVNGFPLNRETAQSDKAH
jgi:hypothetical protein